MANRIAVLMMILLIVSGTVLGQGKGENTPDTDDAEVQGLVDMLAQGNTTFSVQSLVLDQPFDDPDAWESYGAEDGKLAVRNGQYVIYTPDTSLIMWGQNQTPHKDVVMQVETLPISSAIDNGYGLMCRADPANTLDGYHFWISGDGYAAIVISVDGISEYLVEWTRQVYVNPGQELNEVTVVCVGDYLALYANGALLIETNDSTFTQGLAGMSAIGFEEGAPTEIAFDNLQIWSADSGQRSGDLRGLASSEAALVPEMNRILKQGSQTLAVQSLLLDEVFDLDDAWELYQDEESSLAIESGRYLIRQTDNTIMWGQNREIHDDIVMQVETEQLSTQINNGYGLMCRADAANTVDGYHFYISGDGYYAIMMFKNLEAEMLVDWTRSNAINLGQESNTLTVACVGDYLAFYANGILLAEISDTTYQQGATGMAAVTFVEGDPVEIAFDNLRLWTVAR